MKNIGVGLNSILTHENRLRLMIMYAQRRSRRGQDNLQPVWCAQQSSAPMERLTQLEDRPKVENHTVGRRHGIALAGQ